MVTVEFADGNERMHIRHVLIHLPVWEIYRRFGFGITKDKIIHKLGPVSKASFIQLMNTCYMDIFQSIIAGTEELENKQEIRDKHQELKDAIWKACGYYNEFGLHEICEYNGTISLVELSRFALQEEIAPILHPNLDETKGTAYIEKQIAYATEDLIKAITTKELKHNPLKVFQQAGVINKNQLPQTMIAFGLRTEINDKIIAKPVTGSSLTGFKNVLELGIEQQAARKTEYYSRTAIRKSQYCNRTQQLCASAIQRIYDKPCGTHNTLPYRIDATNYYSCIGKNILENGKIVTLMPENVEKYIDKTVNMFSALTCRHTDGVCTRCFGILHYALPKDIGIGLNAASQVISDVGQKILSTKHFIKTLSQEYVLPSFAANFLGQSKSLGIYLKPDIFESDKNFYIGLYFKDLRGSLADLHHINTGMMMPEERYSEIPLMYLKDRNGNVIPLELATEDQAPYLTMQFLLYMKSRYDDIVIDESMFWVPMDRIKHIPILKTTIINDSMMGYVSKVINFLEHKGLTKYKSASAALQQLTSIVYSKVNTNIVNLEVLLKAHLVTGPDNYSIPVVTDPNQVLFKTTIDINKSRTLSGLLAFQGLKSQLINPNIYTQPRDTGQFDTFFNF